MARDCCAIFQQSAGEPRRTPSIASPTPRSSTHSPQFTQLSGAALVRIRHERCDPVPAQRVIFLRNVVAVHGVGMACFANESATAPP